ncbi:MAG: TRAP transporter substrate-binding protein DctP [Thermodesulfobacteriota bacterium]
MTRAVLLKCLVILFVIPIFSTHSYGPAFAKTFALSIGSGVAADPLPFVKAVRDFWCPEVAKRVEKATGHKIKWNYAFGGSVVKLGDELEAVQAGVLDAGIVFPIFENPMLFIHNFGYFAPFGTSDIDLATRVNLKVYDDNPWLKEVFHKKYNQKWIGTFTYESYELITRFAVKTNDDLKGHKLAAAGPNLPWISAVGCVPVQSSLAEAYTCLQMGVYEGWVMTPSYTWGMKLYEVAPYLTYSGFGCISAASITMNLDVWKSLPQPIQEIMMEVGREYSFVVAKDTKAKTDMAVQDMKQKGVKFYTLPLEEKKKWMSSITHLPSQKAKEADNLGQPGTHILKYYVAEMAKAGFDWPVKWVIQ